MSSLMLILGLIFMVVLSSLYFYLLNVASWMMVVVLLIYLGGVLVLFMYMSTLNYKKYMFASKSGVFLLLPLLVPVYYSSELSYSGSLTTLSLFSNLESVVVILLLVLLLTLSIISYILGKSYLPFRIS